MPGRGTPVATLRVAEALWTRFGAAAARAGSNRGAVLRAFIKWYVRDAGAQLPDRPD